MASIKPDSRELVHQTDATVVRCQCAVSQLEVNVGRSHHGIVAHGKVVPVETILKAALASPNPVEDTAGVHLKTSVQILGKVPSLTPIPRKTPEVFSFFRPDNKKVF